MNRLPKITLQEEFIISSITANKIVCNYKHTTIHDGQGQGTVTEKKEMRLKKIDIDYHTDIVGMWECKEYIADGTLVAIRWKDQGKDELRECWEVNSLKDGKMQWKALRAKEDGTTFKQTVDWERW